MLEIEALRVAPGSKVQLLERDPRDTLGIEGKEAAHKRLGQLHDRLDVIQTRLFAEASTAFYSCCKASTHPARTA